MDKQTPTLTWREFTIKLMKLKLLPRPWEVLAVCWQGFIFYEVCIKELSCDFSFQVFTFTLYLMLYAEASGPVEPVSPSRATSGSCTGVKRFQAICVPGGQQPRQSLCFAQEQPQDIPKFERKEWYACMPLSTCKGLSWWLRQESICLQFGRPRFDPWVGKILWRRKWQPTSVLSSGESHGQRSLVGYSPWGHKESDMTELLHFLSFFFLSQLDKKTSTKKSL